MSRFLVYRVERCRQVVQLYQGFQKLSEILKDKPSAGTSSSTSAAGKKKRGRPGKENASASSGSSTSAKYASLFSLRFVTEFLRALFRFVISSQRSVGIKLDLLTLDIYLFKYFSLFIYYCVCDRICMEFEKLWVDAVLKCYQILDPSLSSTVQLALRYLGSCPFVLTGQVPCASVSGKFSYQCSRSLTELPV